MKFANVKAMVAKSMILALAAGALSIASPIKAEAQHFVFGVGIGNPYYAPRYQGYDQYNRQDRDDQYNRQDRNDRYYAPRYNRYELERREEFQRREAFFRHQQWLRMHQDDGRYDYR